jgi:hypothetical protein
MDVDLDGVLGQVEPPCDLFVGHPVADELHDLTFSLSQCSP